MDISCFFFAVSAWRWWEKGRRHGFMESWVTLDVANVSIERHDSKLCGSDHLVGRFRELAGVGLWMPLGDLAYMT